MFPKQSDLTPEACSGHKKPNYLSQANPKFGSNDPSLRCVKNPLVGGRLNEMKEGRT